MTIPLPTARSLSAGVFAGIVGAVTLTVYVVASNAAQSHAEVLHVAEQLFAFTASAAVGPRAFAGGAYVTLGVLVHVLVSIGWGLGYAYAAQREAQLVRRPVLSGLGFGLVVYFAMQLVLVVANLFEKPTPGSVGSGLLGHCVFFGLPVALVVARLTRDA